MKNLCGNDELWNGFLSNLKDYGIIVLEADGNIAAWNDGAEALYGYRQEEVRGAHLSRFYPADARALGHPDRELAIAASVGRYEEEGWRVRKDRTQFWAHVVITAIYDQQQNLTGFGKVVRDITAQKQAVEQATNIMNLLEYTARTDYLTGIGNRRSLDKVLAAAMSSAARRQRPFSLAMIDLDWFKRYNDDFGHQKGDLYLRDAAAKWRGVLRPEDSISRYGGEEFVVLLADTAREGAMSCLERLRLATPAPLTCSIGVAQWNGSESGGALIDRADQAVYQAKAGGRNRLVFNPERNFAEAPRTPVLVC